MTLCTDIDHARFRVQGRWKYMGRIIMGMTMVETPDVPRLAIDQWWRTYWNREWVFSNDLSVVAFAFGHETLHCAHRHAMRCLAYFGHTPTAHELSIWGLGCDCEINPIMEADATDDNGVVWWKAPVLPREECQSMGFPIGTLDIILPELYGFENWLTAEQYTSLLLKNDLAQHQSKGQGGGSCADGQQKAWEEGSPDDSDVPGSRQYQQDVAVDKMADKLEEMVNASSPGTGPGSHWVKWLGDLRSSGIDFREATRDMIVDSCERIRGKRKPTFMRPNRRQMDSAFICAGTYDIRVTVRVLLDVSGSMGGKRTDDAFSAIQDALEDLQLPRATVYTWDAKLQGEFEINHIDDISITGRGGTDMAEAVRAIDDLNDDGSIIMVVTDCETDWPSIDQIESELLVVATADATDYWLDRIPEWIPRVQVQDAAHPLSA